MSTPVCGFFLASRRSALRILILGLAAAAPARLYAQLPPPTSSGPVEIPSAPRSDVAGPGWQPLVIPMTAEEKALHDQMYGVESPLAGTAVTTARQFESVLPPQHDAINTTVGLGYVQGADAATEITALGSANGLRIDLSTLTTFGPKGVELYSGYMALTSEEHRWTAEAGDVYTELRGPSRGVRWSWFSPGGSRHGLALYMPRFEAQTARTAVAYAEQRKIFPGFVLGGEVASDRSHIVTGQLATGRLNVDASYRGHASGVQSDGGLFAQYDLWRGVAIQGGLRSTKSTDSSTWRSVGVHVPIHSRMGITLERSNTTIGQSDQTANAVALNLPLGPVSLMQRYQWGGYEYIRPAGVFAGDQRQFRSVASYSPTSRVSLGLQMANQWQADGSVRQWQELLTTVHLSRKSEFQAVTAFPNLTDASQLRVQLAQQLPRRFSLVAEYGRLSPFQSVTTFEGESSRFKLMLRRSYDVRTPAAGGQVAGLVVDTQGFPMAGIGVRLGQYRTASDERGRYTFSKLPRGDYDLSLDEETLPASYASGSIRRSVAVTGGSRHQVDLVIVPLNAIRGYVYCDVNRNGTLDAGEEVPFVAVRLGDRVTATDQDGAFTFGNVEPGEYRVNLVVEHLPAQYEPASAAEVAVTLGTDKPVVGVEFRLAKKEKKVVLQELSR